MTTATKSPDVDRVTGEVMEVSDIIPTISEASLRAEVDQQIVTARRFPRQIQKVMNEALSMATRTEDVAAACIYNLPRGGKAIKGPSVRLAEIMVTAWGNIRAEARVGDADATHATAEAVCWDLEKNVAVRIVTKRRITDRNGRRYNEDGITQALNAASSIAFRNAVFRVVPRSFVNEVYDAAESVAVGNIATLAERRGKAVEFFQRYGITADRVAAAVEKPSIEALTLEDVAQLKAMAESLKRGDRKIDDLFPDPARAKAEADAGGNKGATGLAAEVGKIAGDVAAKAGEKNATPAQAERAAKVKEQAAKMAESEPCAKGKPGCSDDITNGICSNHAPAGDGLPGMSPPRGTARKK